VRSSSSSARAAVRQRLLAHHALQRLTAVFEQCIATAVAAMTAVAVAAATVHLGVTLFRELARPPHGLLGPQQTPHVFGLVLTVLIGLGLLATTRAYLSRSGSQVEVVFMVAMVAIARRVILLEVKHQDAPMLMGVAALMLALAAGFFLLRRAGGGPAARDKAGPRPGRGEGA